MYQFKILLVYLLLIFAFQCTYGQTPGKKSENAAQSVQIITINFKGESGPTIDMSKVEDLKKGDFFRIKLCGLNLHNYKIIINNTDSIYAQNLELPDFSSFSLDVLSTLLNTLNVGISAFEETTKLSEDLTKDSLIKFFKDFDYEASNFSSSNLDQLEKAKSEEIPKTFATQRTIQLFYGQKAKEIKSAIDDLKLSAFLRYLEAKKNNPQFKNDFNYSLALKKLQEIIDEIKTFEKEVKEVQNNYNAFFKVYRTVIEATPNFKEEDKKIKSFYTNTLKVLTEAKSIINSDNIYKLLLPLVYIENNLGDFYSIPYQLNGQQKILNIKFEPWDSESRLPIYETELIFPEIYEYQGVGASFYVSSLYDESFSIGPARQGSDENFSIIDEKPDEIEFGSAALFRLGAKLSRGFGAHFTVGAGVSLTQKIRPRLLIGGGITVGKTHMMALDFGVISGFVERQSELLKDETSTLLSPPSEVTVAKLNHGVFLSIGYVYKL